MDIFEEIKEAVLATTPGEDTRNYYRNQGMKIEQERIIKLLQSQADLCDTKHLAGIYQAIALIKGEK